MILVLFKVYKQFEISVVDSNRFKADYLETLIRRAGKEIEILDTMDQRREKQYSTQLIRRFHCGLNLNGGFVEHEVPDLQTIINYDVLGGLNTGNFLARRSLEDMQATEGQYWGHRVMLEAATDGATPSEGPLNRIFKIGNREISVREQYIAEQASQMCGRLGAKLEQLNERHWNLMSRGLQEAANVAEKRWRSIKNF